MNATASAPSAEGRSRHTYALLLLSLIPIAVGAIWVAKYGSHGDRGDCSFDEKGEWATFKWNHYSTTDSELRLRTFNLNSGKQVSKERRLARIGPAGDSWAIEMLGRGKFKLFRWNNDPSQSYEPITFSIPAGKTESVSPSTVIDGLVLATEFTENATRVVLIDPKTSKVVDEAEVAGRVELYHWRKTNFVELARGLGVNPNCTRVKVDGGKILVDSTSRTGHFISPVDELGQSYAVIVSPNGKSVEVRAVDDDEVQHAIELPNIPVNSPAISYFSGASWVSLGALGGIPVISLDFLSGKELPVPPGWLLADRNRVSKIMLVTTPGLQLVRAPGKAQAKLVHEESGAIIADLECGEVLASKFIAGGEQLLIANSDQRILQLDARSGKVLKTIAPYWFVPYLEILPAVAFFCWAYAWIRFSSVVHRHAWIDCAMISGLCIGYVILRTRMTGFPGDAYRPIYQFAEGIFASWLILTSMWLVLGRTRLSLRVLPQIGIVGLIILIALICLGFQNPRVWDLVIATILLCIWLIVACVPLRFMGYKFLYIESSVNHEPQASLATGAIPMRDIFLLTTVLAGMFALGRYAPPGLQLTLKMVLDVFVVLFAVTFTGLASARFGLSQRSYANRVLTILVAAAFSMVLPVLWMAFNLGWKAFTEPDTVFLFWELRLNASIVLATGICLYAFRLRGWRLTRSRVTSADSNHL